MKVLHLISGGDTGGAKTHLLSLFKGFENLLDASIICLMDGVFYREALNEGIDARLIEQKSRMDLTVVDRIRDISVNENFDLIHCHGARANFIGIFLKGKIDIPMVTTIHSDYELDFKDNFYKRIIFTNLNKFALKRFKYFIAVSQNFKDMLINRGFKRDNIFVSYNGIDINEKREYVSKEEFLNRYNIKDNGQIFIGILGRLDEVKDHKTFVKMAKEILKIHENVEFLIGGDGGQLDNIKALINELNIGDKVHLLGEVKDPYSFFNTIDINILTSLSESFPYVVLEGGLMKKPLISTRVGGLVDLIINGENGYLTDVESYKTLAEKTNILIEDEGLRIKMGENLYENIKKNYSSETMGKVHLKIYEEILKRERRSNNG